ncbi:MAG TPA: L,D-transpeptidase [Candidatus Binatia bacterium]|jgi:murein L,D-transpeptidase YafK
MERTRFNALAGIAAASLTACIAAGRACADERVPAATRVSSAAGVEVVVYKSERKLALYRGGRFEREFRVVLGLDPDGAKLHENDARTPEGLYRIIARHPHARWQFYLALDYPNARDRRNYEDARGAGRIPDDHGKPFAIGGSVAIHGNDRLVVQDAGIDWTKGCIALSDPDIRAVAAEVPVGTPVWIVP